MVAETAIAMLKPEIATSWTTTNRQQRTWHRAATYGASLLCTLPFIPLLAAAVTVVAYLAPNDWWQINNSALLVGLGFAIVAWGVCAIVCWRIATPDANTREASVLVQRITELQANLDAHSRARSAPSEEAGANAAAPDNVELEQAACLEAQRHIDISLVDLSHNSVDWVLALGYINIWNRVHRAEEAIILVTPREQVIEWALLDEMRLRGSEISDGEALAHQLRTAVAVLDADSLNYFEAKQPNPVGLAPVSNRITAPHAEMQARTVLRGVRNAINTFRDERRDGLARARSQLLQTIIGAGLTTYLVLLLAITLNVAKECLVAATTFYLVGAIVGLFNRLYSQSQSDNAVEDYGLSGARALLTPILSGLAAIGGVVVIAMLPMIGATPGNSSAAGVITPDRVPVLRDIFDLGRYQFGIVVAAIFGLTPGLLIERLKQQTEVYTTDLKTSGITVKAGRGNS